MDGVADRDEPTVCVDRVDFPFLPVRSSGTNVNERFLPGMARCPLPGATEPGDSFPILSTMASAGESRLVRSCSFCALSKLSRVGSRSLRIHHELGGRIRMPLLDVGLPLRLRGRPLSRRSLSDLVLRIGRTDGRISVRLSVEGITWSFDT